MPLHVVRYFHITLTSDEAGLDIMKMYLCTKNKVRRLRHSEVTPGTDVDSSCARLGIKNV